MQMHEVLNVECLRYIFSYLSPHDILNLEQSTPDIKPFTTSYWDKIKDLDIAFIPEYTLSRLKEMGKIRRPKTKWLFQKYEAGTWKCLDDRSVILSKLADNCRNLKTVSITSDVKDSDLMKLLASNPGIEHLVLNFNTVLNGECLAKAPVGIRKLELCGSFNIKRDLLFNFIKACNLQSFKTQLELFDNDFIKDLVVAAPNLEEFTLKKSSRTKLSYIKKFKQLKRLGLRDISEEIFNDLIRECRQLEVLELHSRDEHCETPIKFKNLALNLSELKYLILDDTYLAGKRYLTDFIKNADLEILEVHSCRRFTDEVAEIVLENSPNLIRLELNRCHVTEELSKIAVKHLNNQIDRKKPLNLIIKNVKLDAPALFEHSHDLLKLAFRPPLC